MHHRITGILLLFCLAAPCILTIVGLQHQKYLVKKAVKQQIIAGLDDSSLVFLKFSKTETETVLHWEHGSEFEYQGQMFDIVETVEKGDSVFYRCWPDHKESSLNRELAMTVAGSWDHHPLKKQETQRLLHFFKILYCTECPSWHPPTLDRSFTKPHWLFFFDLPEGAFSPLVPPPDTARV